MTEIPTGYWRITNERLPVSAQQLDDANTRRRLLIKWIKLEKK